MRVSGKVFRYLKYVSYAAYLAGLHYFFFFRPYVGRLHETKRLDWDSSQARGMDLELLGLVGEFSNESESAFHRHPREKPPGVTRLCAFGDSFTRGDEVDPGFDYPTLLERELRRIGSVRIEVLNFGSPWHGFHQTFLLWSRLAPRYACDVTLLGPSLVHPDRDTTFQHTGDAYPYYLHSRYVLEGPEGVRLVSVAGQTQEERFRDYFRYWPSWEQLRYDRNLPPILRCLLPTERAVPLNPFYYFHGGRQAEALATYAVLLRRMAQSGPVLLGAFGHEAVAIGRQVGDRVRAIEVGRIRRFPYEAPERHNSPLGNLHLARLLARTLSAPRPSVLRFLTTEPTTLSAGEARTARDLSSYSRLDFEIDGRTVGGFIALGGHDPTRTLEAGLKGKGIVSLLGFQAPDQSAVDACWVPLPHELRSDQTIEIEVRRGPEKHRTVLRPLERLTSLPALGIVAGDGLRCSSGSLRFDAPELPGGPATEAALSVAGAVILRGGVSEGEVTLQPVAGEWYGVRAAGNVLLDPESMAEQGVVRLRVSHPVDGEWSVPLARWRVTSFEGLPAEPPPT